MSSEEPKLIIDEDWKSQVQREKEQSTEASPVSAAREKEAQPDQPLPPASFELLVSGLATQAVASLGQMPGEDGQPLPSRPEYARHFIDLLDVLESKTSGNLTDAESQFLKGTLHQLRMLFIVANK